MNTEPTTNYFKFLKETTPLDLDPALVSDYLECFKSDACKALVMDEMEHHYNEMEKDDRKERLQRISVIGASNINFPEDDEEIDDIEINGMINKIGVNAP